MVKIKNYALHEAVRSLNLEMVYKLLDDGVDVNELDCYENTALHIAANLDTIFKRYCKTIGHLNVRTTKVETHWQEDGPYVVEEVRRIMNALIDAGAELLRKNRTGDTPLCLIIENERKYDPGQYLLTNFLMLRMGIVVRYNNQCSMCVFRSFHGL